MGRAWNRYDLGIALGFGIQAAVALANAAFRARLNRYSAIFDTAEGLTYDLTCLIWLITFWKAEQPTPHVSQTQLSPALLAQAKSWESGLKDLVKSKKDSE